MSAFICAAVVAGSPPRARRAPRCALRPRVDASGVNFIRLEEFLKLRGVAGTGGHAKMLVVQGDVDVNGSIELRRGRKLRQGDRVLVRESGDGNGLVVQFGEKHEDD